MAEALNPPPDEPGSSPPLVKRPPKPPGHKEQSHSRKFRFVYAGLVLVVVAAIAGLVIILGKPSPPPPAAWSGWQPSGDTNDAKAKDIASHVAGRYRLASGSQLVSVEAAPLRVQKLPVVAIAIKSSPSGATFSGNNIPIFDASKSVVYILCGLGQNCAIEEGTASVERQRLLRREALELALYTFRYVDGKDYVVAFMPPRPGTQPAYALFFQRTDLSAELDRPLRATLPDAIPPFPDAISRSETQVIDELTNPRFFAFRFQQAQDGTAFLVLDDPNTAPPPQSTTTTQQGTGGQTTDHTQTDQAQTTQ